MKNWFDKEQLYCINCKHRWILISNKEITDEQHNIWVRTVLKHHEQIQKEREDNGSLY